MSIFDYTMTVSGLLCLLLIIPISAQVPPGIPSISSPGFVVENNLVTLTCTSRGGVPAPSIKWYRGSTNGILVDDTSVTTNGVTTNSYTFTATRNDHRIVYECQVDNDILQEKLTVTTFFEVYTQPNQPTVSGPATILLGTTNQWTCISTGGNPAPIITMRIENSQFTSGITQNSVKQPDNTYISTSTLLWTPSLFNHGQTLYCDARHPQTSSSIQTASLQLTVNAEPNEPFLTGPSVVRSGITSQWACTSMGGRPLPSMTIRIGNRQFSTEVTITSTIQSDLTYTVTGVLRWAPNVTDHGLTIYCDIQHQETGGNNLQTASVKLTVNAEPNNPVLSGPSDVVAGSTQQWECRSTGGNPEPEMTFRIENNQITNGLTKTTMPQADNTYTVINLLTWVPSLSNVGQTLYCDVRHQETRGNNLLTDTLTLNIYAEPNHPVLTGPTTVIAGSTQPWSCVSSGGTPAPEVTFRIGNTPISNGVSRTSVRQPDNTFNVTMVLSWTPSLSNVGQSLYCDVRHPETRGNNLQTTSLFLTIYVEPNNPMLTGPTTVIAGSTQQWSCVSSGGVPEPEMILRIENHQFTNEITKTSLKQSDASYTITSLLSWAPTLSNIGQKLYCDVRHEETRGSSLQTTAFNFTINVEPDQPTLTGPTSVPFGTTGQWACVSTGGKPAPTMTMKIGNTPITTDVTRNSVLQSDNTYTVTTTLSWSPTAADNGQTLFCEVKHQETRGGNSQMASLQIGLTAEPKQPTLTGPSVVTSGSTNQWTCTSMGGIPAPSITMRIGNTEFISGVTVTSTLQSDSTYTTTAVLSWEPNFSHNDKRLYCDVQHQESRGSNLQTVGVQLSVSLGPSQPAFTGPSNIVRGSLNQWTCISTGGTPAPEVTFSIESTRITSGVTVTSVRQSDNTYTVTGILSWAADLQNNGQTLYCNVRSSETDSQPPQSVSITLQVDDPLSVSVYQTSYQPSLGSEVVMNCTVTGTVSSVQWYLNNQQLTITGSSKYSNGDKIIPSLTISNVETSDAGNYYCRASNDANTITSEIVTLSIQDPSTGAATGTSDTALSSGEIAAILLAILFFIMLGVVIVFCCCQGYCAGLFGKKKEKATIQPSKTEYPVFYEEPEYRGTYRGTHKRQKKYRKSADYHIDKYVVLRPEDTVQFRGSRPLSTDMFVRSPYGESFYVPAEEYTFDEEERRRRRKTRKHSSRRERTNDFTNIATTLNGDVQRTSSTRYSERSPVRTPRSPVRTPRSPVETPRPEEYIEAEFL